MSSRGMPKTKEIRATLRKQAEARQEKRANLTIQQKLDMLPPTGCNKQRARYLAQLEKAKQASAVVAEPAPETKEAIKEKKAAKEEAKRLKKENKQ